MSETSVVIFGASGKVGSIAARTAHQNGVKVFLALRDINKPIPGLSAEEERSGGFGRVTADLDRPDTVDAAIRHTGAKRAFFYASHSSSGFMRETIKALKKSGIEFAVFLSSYTITGEPGDVQQEDLVAYLHAQVEMNLKEIFGSHEYVAIRPGSFATNLLRYKPQILSGTVHLYSPDYRFDYVAPEDIGAVCGSILAKGGTDCPNYVYVHGPKQMTQRYGIALIADTLERDVRFEDANEEQELITLSSIGIPKHVACYIINKLKDPSIETPEQQLAEGRESIRRFAGREPMSLHSWLRQNKQSFM
ncbi:hypothetical protein FSARC_7827 [Fusarium sarcochroum]|uniref:NAD(P)-binding domain-containing protein n=1 Tax=Fusarium sarcochroum TaxID=1208366 RepID=A0A8H4TUC2_9HYPO|nr:hypothetical protein FSARC_7827 [Fusarium sarcochroum]